MYAGLVLVVAAAGCWYWYYTYTTITVARDTTYLTAPLADDGYPDYVAYLNQINLTEVTLEENAFYPMLVWMNAFDDRERQEFFNTFLKLPEHLNQNAFLNISQVFYNPPVPDEVLVASSIAAQLPWHERFARLAALNIELFAPLVQTGLTPDEFAVDEEALPDLSPNGLAAQQPPEYTTPEEIADWRKEQFQLARSKLFQREQDILDQRVWSRAECPIAAYWLDQQSANLEQLLKEMFARPKFFAPYLAQRHSKTVFSLSLQGPDALRTISEALQFRAREALSRGDVAAALRDGESILRLSTMLPPKPVLVEMLTALNRQKAALELFDEIVLHPQTTDAQLTALAQHLEEPQPRPDFAQGLESDRLAILDYFVAIQARGSQATMLGEDQYWERSMVCWNEVLRRVNELFDIAIAAAKARDWAALQQLGQQIATQPAHYLELKAAFDARSFWLLPSQRTEVMKYMVPNLMMGAVVHSYTRFLEAEDRYNAARLYLAVERFRRAHGKRPAKIEELVPKYLPTVPLDPFTDKPLEYTPPVGEGDPS